MGAVLLGIVLVVVGILLWVHILTLAHAVAIFIILVGLLIALFGYRPVWFNRGVNG